MATQKTRRDECGGERGAVHNKGNGHIYRHSWVYYMHDVAFWRIRKIAIIQLRVRQQEHYSESPPGLAVPENRQRRRANRFSLSYASL